MRWFLSEERKNRRRNRRIICNQWNLCYNNSINSLMAQIEQPLSVLNRSAANENIFSEWTNTAVVSILSAAAARERYGKLNKSSQGVLALARYFLGIANIDIGNERVVSDASELVRLRARAATNDDTFIATDQPEWATIPNNLTSWNWEQVVNPLRKAA